MTLHVTDHAIDRYRERVADVPIPEAAQALRSPAIVTAASIGARYVKLPGKQRVVIVEHSVVTVLPADHSPGSLTRERDWRFEELNDG